ncbi:Ribosome-binding ATPase YchF [bioreactor metagenome]|uniref:Ribosome-binding ATPase YchF n=1 Tax=bioreactor metagenome TaxID=1076179 RepID=A0A644TYP5_9ZZZZ|nr:redox-regulated ATPase YchF [Methanobrevibacter sp.]MEA4956481.1 redox-regulated ATPase YchF [Methanobrevibacter sp.]
MLQIAVTGKPNVGKSSFFNSATTSKVEMADYPFTTIDANKAIANVVKPCPCVDLNLTCNPRNSECIDGKRYIHVELIDVAGLVPGAHEGRGLGNKFLDDLRQAKVFIHVIDASGSTDEEGRPVDPGTHDPLEDIEFLEYEIVMWMYGILNKNWDRLIRKIEAEKLDVAKVIYEQMSGTGVSLEDVIEAKRTINPDYQKWEKEDLILLVTNLRKISKPMLIVANKADLPTSEENIKRIKEKYPDVIPASADSELALVNASKAGLINYNPGESNFEILDEENLNKNQLNALNYIKENVLDKYGSTGVQKAINTAVFELLNMIVVYPVEDEHKFTDNNGNVLPDPILIKMGSNPRNLAYVIHTDIGDKFMHAVNAKKNMRVASDYELCDGDIISIITS